MKKASIFGSLCLCLAGCVSVKDTLGYAPIIEQREKNHIAMCITPFEDQRSDIEFIGEARDVLGIPIVEIITEDSVPDWVRHALKLELTNAGYSIIDTHGEDSYTIEGKILKAFASARFSHRGYMAIEIGLRKGSEIIFQKIYKVSKKDGLALFEHASCTEVLKYNLQEVCKNFIADVNEHLLNHSV